MAAEMLPRGDEPGYFVPAGQGALSAALAKAQGSFKPIHRDKTVTVTMKSGGKYSFSYAPLETILAAVMPALSANGLSLTQSCVMMGEKEYVRTQLRHSSGELIENNTRILIGDAGPQAYGSALTYARRYGVTLLLCISADDDDDGNAAEGNEAQQTGRPVDPRGEGHKHVNPAERARFVSSITDILAQDVEEEVHASQIYAIHQQLAKDQDLYIAVGDELAAKKILSKAGFKELVSKGKPKPGMMPNGRAS
jgi:hypothetical protein